METVRILLEEEKEYRETASKGVFLI